MNEADHPAAQANMKSIKYAQEHNREAWLALYRDDAVVADPVGKSPFDPEGNGHQGKEAIAAFFDNVIAQSNAVITAGKRRLSGERWCAVPMTAESDLGGGMSTKVDMIAVYEVDEQGLIKSMRAYWDWDDMEAQLKSLGLA